MPQNWKTYELRDLVNYVNGGSWAASCYGNTGIPVVRVSDVNNGTVDLANCKYLRLEFEEKYKKHSLNYKDVIVCTVGSHPDQQSSVVGGIGIVDSNSTGAFLNQNAVLLRSENSNVLNQIWLGYFCKSSIVKNHIESEARGSANQVRIAISNLLNLNFDLPPLPEQTAIASILSTIDAKIENNLAINKTLEEMAMALYKEWFVDFGPFQDGKFVDSELGMIPEGWEVKSIHDICEVIYGAAFKSKLFNKEGVGFPLIRIRDLKTNSPQYFTEENHKKKTIIEPGNLIAGMDAEFRPHFWFGKKAVLNQRMVFFKGKIENTEIFLFHSIAPWLKFYEGAKVGTTVIHLGKGDIDKFKIVVPTNEVLMRFIDKTKSIHSRQVANMKQNQSLTSLRDTLLPKLISGEVRLNEFANR